MTVTLLIVAGCVCLGVGSWLCLPEEPHPFERPDVSRARLREERWWERN